MKPSSSSKGGKGPTVFSATKHVASRGFTSIVSRARILLVIAIVLVLAGLPHWYRRIAWGPERHVLPDTRIDEHCPTTTFSVEDPPYSNYFISDCRTAAQVIVTSKLPRTQLSNSNARLLVAWPAGNSGAVAYFGSATGGHEPLGMEIVNSTVGEPLGTIYQAESSSRNPTHGVSTQIRFDISASMTLATMGSIRTIREGPGNTHPEIQAMKYNEGPDGSVVVSRLWLDKVTTSRLSFTPTSGGVIRIVNGAKPTLAFDSGTYIVNATFDYPQLHQLSAKDLLAEHAYGLITEKPEQVEAVRFMSFTTKLLAGGWHYYTYFGRDSMISALLFEPILSQGNGSVMEAVIGAVLERVDSADGTVCHEETIGDYATWTHRLQGVDSTDAICTYHMIDTDYFLPILMEKYFVEKSIGAGRAADFFKTHVSFFPSEADLTYEDKALQNARRILDLAAPFAGFKNQTIANLIHLKDGLPIGQWRDSADGLGSARIPFDVNTALMPAALRAIGKLARAGVYDQPEWESLADEYASVWETETLSFFEVSHSEHTAKSLVKSYVDMTSFPGPDHTDSIDGDVEFYALAITGPPHPFVVEAMHSDTAFRLLLINDTNDAQLSRFLNNTAKSVMRTFPSGLLTDVGMLIVNPAYGSQDRNYYAQTWTPSRYHGTVVWGFTLAMMARGFELQLARCYEPVPHPEFCSDPKILGNVKAAYNKLWDSIEANEAHLANELWTWTYSDGSFRYEPYGQASSEEEGDAIQLWSLTFLAIARNEALA